MNDSFQFEAPLFTRNEPQERASSEAMPLNSPPSEPQASHSPSFQDKGATPALRALFAPLPSLKGLGPRGQELLTKLLNKTAGPPRVMDLLWHVPSGYMHRPQVPCVEEISPGSVATLMITPLRHNAPPRNAPRAPFRVVCQDQFGGALDIVFFHGDKTQARRLLPLNEPRLVSGRVERYGARLQMAHPDHIAAPPASGQTAEVSIAELEPVYPLTLGLTQKFMHKTIGQALGLLPPVPEWIEPHFLKAQDWPGFERALRALHQPKTQEDLDLWGKARERLGFDEVLASQLALALVRRDYRELPGRSLIGDGGLRAAIQQALPYTLTGSQTEAVAEITADMAAPKRMLRLLQGDVGAGKTVVAALTMAAAVEAGTQAAIMAPTDVLARQHLETFGPLYDAAGIRLGYLSGREQGRSRKKLLTALADGYIHAMVGTHALFQDDVVFHDLGLAVIDEQHRFGVVQRLALQQKAKAADADILLMTATPIPRTLLLSLHSDLDVSRLTEKPAGRKPVATRAVPQERIQDVIDGLERAFREGAQAYWVCPAVETDTAHEMTAVEARAAHLRQIFGERVGFVHGKLPGPEKDAAIAAFAARETSLLVATTVIEVGVNVPNATVMIIENAEMFGLAQLHQLRGRVGRGQAASSCVLLYKGPLSQTAKSRLDILRQVEDGFVIAEEDLRLRGGGEILGARQSGDPGFRLAPWPLPGQLLERAADHARFLLAQDAGLTSPLGAAARQLLLLFERDDAVRLLQAG